MLDLLLDFLFLFIKGIRNRVFEVFLYVNPRKPARVNVQDSFVDVVDPIG